MTQQQRGNLSYVPRWGLWLFREPSYEKKRMMQKIGMVVRKNIGCKMLRRPSWFGLLWRQSAQHLMSTEARSKVSIGCALYCVWCPCHGWAGLLSEPNTFLLHGSWRAKRGHTWGCGAGGAPRDGFGVAQPWATSGREEEKLLVKKWSGSCGNLLRRRFTWCFSEPGKTLAFTQRLWMQWKLFCFLDSSALSSAAEWSFQWEKANPTL